MTNQVIRNTLKEHGVYLYELGDEVGVSEATMIRWMRKEMSPEKTKELCDAILRIEERRKA